MSAELPTITAKQAAGVAERLGFNFGQQRGSHAIYVRASEKGRVVIPMHSGNLKRKALGGIVADLKISVDEFRRML